MTRTEWTKQYGFEDSQVDIMVEIMEFFKRTPEDKHPLFINTTPQPPKIISIRNEPIAYEGIAYNRS